MYHQQEAKSNIHFSTC